VPSTAVVTDSTGYLTPALYEQLEIGVVSLYVNFEGGARTVRELDLMDDLDAFYEDVRAGAQWPTTSQPSVGDFVAVYEPLLAGGRDVVSIHISGEISGTVRAARQAAEALERDGKGGERVHVIDSRTAAGGLGLVALGAARRAAAGAGVEEVLEHAERVREELKLWFALDTLEFLRRGGRIGAASAWIGSTLKIKPILTLEEQITPVERVRTAGRAFERMVDYSRQRASDGADGWVVQHIRSPDEASRLEDACREIHGGEPVFTSEIGPVLGVHTGPGLLGVGGVPRALVEG
jgi:DegV family protein with EDD domain